MKAISYVLFFLLLNALPSHAEKINNQSIELIKNQDTIYGTLIQPKSKQEIPLVIFISGSGPTDRDGNNPVMKNNSIKMLAEGLYKHKIASLRYDKRGIAQSKGGLKSESDIRFDDYIADARDWVMKMKKEYHFSKIIIAGHSEGSLIGMIAAQQPGADAFISLAGAGESADLILKRQLASYPQPLFEKSCIIIDSLKKGKTYDVSGLTASEKSLNSLFRESVQPYLINWFQYNPQTEIKKLTIPVLIIQGSTDIQVLKNDAELLHAAKPDAKYVFIENMNHVLKNCGSDLNENLKTYSDPELHLHKELLENVANFIKTLA